MKDIKSITDLDDSDFIIKWRMTEMCNANCSYCIRKRRHVGIIPEKLAEQNKRLCEVARQITRLLEKTDFDNVKIDFIGGEVSILDLPNICRNITTKKVKIINLTTNFLQPKEYYIGLCDTLHKHGIKATAVASFHYEFIGIDKYFEKIEELRKHFDILACEMVSTTENQELCRQFIKKCMEMGLDYMVEGDLRFDQMKARAGGLIVGSSKKVKKDRYRVCFMDGTERNYASRNQLLMDADTVQNRWQKAIHTKGYVCSNSYDYVYIDFDTAVGRTKNSNLCSNRMPIEDFEIVEPGRCEAENCTLCGHQSLWRW